MPHIVTSSVDYSITLLAADGDKCVVPAKARNVQIATKFDFALPKGLRIMSSSDDEVRHDLIAEEAAANPVVDQTPVEPDTKPEMARSTQKTDLPSDAKSK